MTIREALCKDRSLHMEEECFDLQFNDPCFSKDSLRLEAYLGVSVVISKSVRMISLSMILAIGFQHTSFWQMFQLDDFDSLEIETRIVNLNLCRQ